MYILAVVVHCCCPSLSIVVIHCCCQLPLAVNRRRCRPSLSSIVAVTIIGAVAVVGMTTGQGLGDGGRDGG